jgi:hypothetical protein
VLVLAVVMHNTLAAWDGSDIRRIDNGPAPLGAAEEQDSSRRRPVAAGIRVRSQDESHVDEVAVLSPRLCFAQS